MEGTYGPVRWGRSPQRLPVFKHVFRGRAVGHRPRATKIREQLGFAGSIDYATPIRPQTNWCAQFPLFRSLATFSAVPRPRFARATLPSTEMDGNTACCGSDKGGVCMHGTGRRTRVAPVAEIVTESQTECTPTQHCALLCGTAVASPSDQPQPHITEKTLIFFFGSDQNELA